MTNGIKNYLQVPKKKTCKYKKMLKCGDIITKFHNLLVIALVIIRRTHKAHRTDRGAENPTGPKLPDFTLGHIHVIILFVYYVILHQNRN